MRPAKYKVDVFEVFDFCDTSSTTWAKAWELTLLKQGDPQILTQTHSNMKAQKIDNFFSQQVVNFFGKENPRLDFINALA